MTAFTVVTHQAIQTAPLKWSLESPLPVSPSIHHLLRNRLIPYFLHLLLSVFPNREGFILFTTALPAQTGGPYKYLSHEGEACRQRGPVTSRAAPLSSKPRTPG